MAIPIEYVSCECTLKALKQQWAVAFYILPALSDSVYYKCSTVRSAPEVYDILSSWFTETFLILCFTSLRCFYTVIIIIIIHSSNSRSMPWLVEAVIVVH